MPNYEYHCDKCGHTFDVMRSMHEDPLVWCKCGERAYQILTSCFHSSKDKLYEFTINDANGQKMEFRTKKQFEKYLKDNHKYQITSKRDFDIEKKRMDRNQSDSIKRENRKTVEIAYKWAKAHPNKFQMAR